MTSFRPWATNRRLFLSALGVGTLAPARLFAQELLVQTPRMTEGPFYPDRLPLDQDNDLIVINESITPAVGEITHLTGRILSTKGTPISNALVEIWQCDANGVYLHSRDGLGPRSSRRDTNFQGYGRFTTGAKGEYRFRTIKPVAYSGRPAPHIHVKVSRHERELLTTQIFVRGDEGNQRDGIFNSIRDPVARKLLLGDFRRVPESTIGEFACQMDLIVGLTPNEAEHGA